MKDTAYDYSLVSYFDWKYKFIQKSKFHCKYYSSQVKSWDKRVQTPGMSPSRAGASTNCLFTPDTLF